MKVGWGLGQLTLLPGAPGQEALDLGPQGGAAPWETLGGGRFQPV